MIKWKYKKAKVGFRCLENGWKYGAYIIFQFETESVSNLSEFERFMVLNKSVIRNQTVALSAKPEIDEAESSLKTEKIAFIDAKIKRRWSADYLYELIAYAHAGAPISFSPPRRKAYDRRPLICRKIGLRPTDYDLLDMLKQDNEFENYIYKTLSPVDRTAVGVKKKTIVKKQKEKTVTLEDYL